MLVKVCEVNFGQTLLTRNIFRGLHAHVVMSRFHLILQTVHKFMDGWQPWLQLWFCVVIGSLYIIVIVSFARTLDSIGIQANFSRGAKPSLSEKYFDSTQKTVNLAWPNSILSVNWNPVISKTDFGHFLLDPMNSIFCCLIHSEKYVHFSFWLLPVWCYVKNLSIAWRKEIALPDLGGLQSPTPLVCMLMLDFLRVACICVISESGCYSLTGF